MPNKTIDDRDERLLAILERDARTPVAELARAVNLSANAVRQRLARLERDGVIEGYTIRRGGQGNAGGISVVLSLTLTGAKCKALHRDFGHLPEIRKFWSTAGELDACLLLTVDTIERLQEISESLGDHPVVQRVQSHVIIDTLVDR